MAFMKVKDLRNSATTANNTLTYMYIKLTCTVQGSFLEQHILWPDNLQTQSLRSQTCWRALLDAPEPGGLNTHTHTDIHTCTKTLAAWVHTAVSVCVELPVTSSLMVSGEVHLPSGWSVSNLKWYSPASFSFTTRIWTEQLE